MPRDGRRRDAADRLLEVGAETEHTIERIAARPGRDDV
jgi:hypothetical protein